LIFSICSVEQERKNYILKLFGEHLKKIRNTKNISLRKLEQLAEVDHSQIHRIEKGETAPSLTTLISIAEGLKISLKELIEYEGSDSV